MKLIRAILRENSIETRAFEVEEHENCYFFLLPDPDLVATYRKEDLGKPFRWIINGEVVVGVIARNIDEARQGFLGDIQQSIDKIEKRIAEDIENVRKLHQRQEEISLLLV